MVPGTMVLVTMVTATKTAAAMTPVIMSPATIELIEPINRSAPQDTKSRDLSLLLST